ncbi:MAG: hypothetical protein R3C20_22675 [Planctomycetaceae bacterium]
MPTVQEYGALIKPSTHFASLDATIHAGASALWGLTMSVEIRNPQGLPVRKNRAVESSSEATLEAIDTATASLQSVITESAAPIANQSNSTFTFKIPPYRELKRRLWHMAPGLLAFGLHVESHADPITPTLRWIVVVACAVIALRIFHGFRHIQRQGEGTGASAVAGYALSVLLTVLLFPGHLEIGVAVLAILAFGDGSATLCGLTFRGPRLPWNRSKSWSGLMSFVVVGTFMTTWVYWGETHNPEAADPPISLGLALAIVAPAVLLAGVAESLRVRLNDNVRVGFVAAVAMSVMHFSLRF